MLKIFLLQLLKKRSTFTQTPQTIFTKTPKCHIHSLYSSQNFEACHMPKPPSYNPPRKDLPSPEISISCGEASFTALQLSIWETDMEDFTCKSWKEVKTFKLEGHLMGICEEKSMEISTPICNSGRWT